ncbi:MAG TPA: ATP-binding protein, partial [Polyangiaceae bacterium]|nr:ATP-binding protein [Polyangiaceae bacterium]
KLARAHASTVSSSGGEREFSVAQWVWSHSEEAGLGTSTLPGGHTLFVPLMASGGIAGVLGLSPTQPDRFDSLEQRRQVDAFAVQMAMAIERTQLAEETERARREVETEQLRSSLLSSVSHDLRTPLAVITGAAGTLVENQPNVDDRTRRELLVTILEEAERLNRLIRNLLDMTRLESGAVTVKKEWLPVEELVGAALNRMESRLSGHDVRVELPADLPLVPCDAILVEQALLNLLENATKYGADPIEIRALSQPGEVMLEIADHGPGIPAGHETRIFEKFHRAGRDTTSTGVGLGLAICRAIAIAHGGRIWAHNRDGGGASFRFTLPIDGQAPSVTKSEGIDTSEEPRP